jgi:hypothetical protein
MFLLKLRTKVWKILINIKGHLCIQSFMCLNNLSILTRENLTFGRGVKSPLYITQ